MRVFHRTLAASLFACALTFPVGAQILARAARMVDVFTEYVGDFPYEKLAHVQSATRFGGMENSSAIFYAGAAVARGAMAGG